MALVTVAVFPNEFEAELAKNFLESRGITSYSSGGVAPAALRGAVTGSVVQVEEDDVVQATQLLAEVYQKQSRPRESERISKARSRMALIVLLIGFLLLLGALFVIWLVGN